MQKTKHLSRAPPHETEAERAVLAVVLLEPRCFDEVTLALEPADFTDDVNRTIFAAMLRLKQRGLPADATLVVGELRDDGSTISMGAFRRQR
jgi:replicative DNA helicase